MVGRKTLVSVFWAEIRNIIVEESIGPAFETVLTVNFSVSWVL